FHALHDVEGTALSSREGKPKRRERAGGAAGRRILEGTGERCEHACTETVAFLRVEVEGEAALQGWCRLDRSAEGADVGCGGGKSLARHFRDHERVADRHDHRRVPRGGDVRNGEA